MSWARGDKSLCDAGAPSRRIVRIVFPTLFCLVVFFFFLFFFTFPLRHFVCLLPIGFLGGPPTIHTPHKSSPLLETNDTRSDRCHGFTNSNGGGGEGIYKKFLHSFRPPENNKTHTHATAAVLASTYHFLMTHLISS